LSTDFEVGETAGEGREVEGIRVRVREESGEGWWWEEETGRIQVR
jgi:hypothetical protein